MTLINDYEIASSSIAAGLCEYPDGCLEAMQQHFRCHVLKAGEIAEQLGNAKCMNIVLFGSMAKALGMDDIDWEAVKADGVDFAMIRLGYRGYESGQLNLDERFHEYAQGAVDAGLEIGVYFYSQAINASEAEEEARFVLNELSDYKITYPVVFDWEIVGDDTARTNSVSSEELNECASVFCNTIARGGYIPMIYSVKRMALLKYDLSRLAGFDFWLAEYRDEPEFPYEFAMWQYASDGKVNGIEGEVDLNMSFVDYSKVRR